MSPLWILFLTGLLLVARCAGVTYGPTETACTLTASGNPAFLRWNQVVLTQTATITKLAFTHKAMAVPLSVTLSIWKNCSSPSNRMYLIAQAATVTASTVAETGVEAALPSPVTLPAGLYFIGFWASGGTSYTFCRDTTYTPTGGFTKSDAALTSSTMPSSAFYALTLATYQPFAHYMIGTNGGTPITLDASACNPAATTAVRTTAVGTTSTGTTSTGSSSTGTTGTTSTGTTSTGTTSTGTTSTGTTGVPFLPAADSCRIIYGYKYPAADTVAKKYNVATAQGCCDYCSSRLDSTAWTWSSTYATCFCQLPDASSVYEYHADFVSGQRCGGPTCGANCKTWDRRDYVGQPIHVVANVTKAALCCVACSNLPGCNSFTWNRLYKMCYLKNITGSADAVVHPDGVAGLPCTTPACYSVRTLAFADFRGDDVYALPNVHSVAECNRACMDYQGVKICNAFTYNPLNQRCFLKSVDPTKRLAERHNGSTAGIPCPNGICPLWASFKLYEKQQPITFVGAHLATSSGASPQACVQLCNAYPSCNAFYFDTVARTCLLKRSDAEMTTQYDSRYHLGIRCSGFAC